MRSRNLISNTSEAAGRTAWTHHPRIYNLTNDVGMRSGYIGATSSHNLRRLIQWEWCITHNRTDAYTYFCALQLSKHPYIIIKSRHTHCNCMAIHHINADGERWSNKSKCGAVCESHFALAIWYSKRPPFYTEWRESYGMSANISGTWGLWCQKQASQYFGESDYMAMPYISASDTKKLIYTNILQLPNVTH